MRRWPFLLLAAALSLPGCYCSHGLDDDAGVPGVDADPGNRPPVAVLSGPTRVGVGVEVTISGADSFDLDGDPISHEFMMTASTPGTAFRVTGDRARFVPVSPGIYEVSLVVRDATSRSELVRHRVDVSSTPPPIADAGPDQRVPLGAQVTLDGSGSSDPGGLSLTYAWTVVSSPRGAVLESDASVAPTFVADAAGPYVLELVVDNGTLSSAPDRVTVTAEPGGSSTGVGADVRRGVLSSDLVYLAGTLSEGACYRDALAHYSAPNDAVVGFDCYFDSRTAQLAADGRLVYVNTFEDVLREFHCDDCPTWSAGDDYPRDFLDNDPILPTPPCDPSDIRNDLRAFRLSPDGRRTHQCGSSSTWYDPAGAVLFDAGTDAVMSYGWSGFVLARSTRDGFVYDTTGGTRTPVTGLPACDWATARAGETSGFRVVLRCMAADELWRVTDAGVATLEGIYPPRPMGYERYRTSVELADDNTLVEFVSGPMTFEDAIVERTLAGRSDVVYTEETSPEPLVKIHISDLVTGP